MLSFLGVPSAPAAAEPREVRAQPVPHAYALLVGSNPGGAGQAQLRYAEEDAQRMADLLGQLGRFPKTQIRVLLGPDRPQLLAALSELEVLVRAGRERGEQVEFVFYYSGHARANAMQLGSDELLLSELRRRILALPATLSLVVLDACQSGAFSQVKGAKPAASFSYNSVNHLKTSGVAVMASSSPSELSQESETLQGSFFTHHLMVGLRGAGDQDRDGIVSLAEAYRYAYGRTLSATARTAVGTQHVTLETALRGQGDVPITYPKDADAQLELGAMLESDILIESDNVVVAELYKAKGQSLRLALPAGAYGALLRQEGALLECPLSLHSKRVAQLSPAGCRAISDAEARAKGYGPQGSAEGVPSEAWSIELTLGMASERRDAYTDRLEDFGFREPIRWADGGSSARLQLAVSRQLGPHLSAVVDLQSQDQGHYERDLQSTPERQVVEDFDWSSFALAGHVRAHTDVWDNALRLYTQLGAGVGWLHSELESDGETHVGPTLSAAGGVFWMPWRHFGWGLRASYDYAPLLVNEFGERHDSGGLAFGLSLRYRTWRTP
jgi:hypothetical protein